MAAPDVSAITTSFVEFGGTVFGKQVLAWKLREQGIQVRTNVNKPQVLTKLSAVGTPRPYRSQDDLTNGSKFTDRTLTAFQSKWDFDFDPEEFRNTYLNNDSNAPYYDQALNQVATEYLDYLLRSTVYTGVRNASGTTPADICNGWGKIIADEIAATNLTPIATGAITDANGVTKFEDLVAGVPVWMREKGFKIYCSYAKFDNFRKHYRTSFNFQFDKNSEGSYKMDNLNVEIMPASWMGTSGRLIATLPQNLVFGTDLEQIEVAATQRRNIIEVRNMMPAGCQIQDLEAIFVNDVA
jgi:hypothetical protein